MSSSSEATPAWAPALDLTPTGLSEFDPQRVRRAIDDGYRDGYEAGRAEALARAEEQLAAELADARAQTVALLDQLRRTGDRLAEHEARTAQAFAATVAGAAVQLAEALIGGELSDESTAAMAAVERTLGALGRQDGIVVQLHPDDLALVDLDALPADVRVEPNPGLARGDAVARTDDRTVDARIGTALQRALAVLTTDSPEPIR